MAQVLVLTSVAVILLLAVALMLQLWLYLPRTWRRAPFGQIVSYTLAALGGWFISWLGLALGLALLREWWGFTPHRWTVGIINAALIGSLIAILGASNVAMWRWRRGGPVPPVRRGNPRGAIDDD